jgi:hypothetical protein
VFCPSQNPLSRIAGKTHQPCAIFARTTNLCESSRPRRSLREHRLPASCVPHGRAPSGFATFTVTPAQVGPPGCPFPLLSSRFSPVLSGGCGPSGARAGQASRPALAPARGPTTDPNADTLGSRPSHAAASRRALRLRAIRVPPDIRVVFACASPSPCFRFCSLFFSALPACQTDLARPPRC